MQYVEKLTVLQYFAIIWMLESYLFELLIRKEIEWI